MCQSRLCSAFRVRYVQYITGAVRTVRAVLESERRRCHCYYREASSEKVLEGGGKDIGTNDGEEREGNNDSDLDIDGRHYDCVVGIKSGAVKEMDVGGQIDGRAASWLVPAK